MKRALAVYTPVNPIRPFAWKLRDIHHFNVYDMNDRSLFDYEEEEVLLQHNLQKEGLWRGQNVVHHFNQFYERVRGKYEFICKWDDDMVLPKNIIRDCLRIFRKEPEVIGVGLFQEDYGAPIILMNEPRKEGWYGAFSRFYIYRMSVWGTVPVECPWLYGETPETVRGEHSGDPDNSFQIAIKGEKRILEIPSIHLDHRVFSGDRGYGDYRVLLDLAYFNLVNAS